MASSRRPLALSEQLRQAIVACGLSRYRISQLTGIDQATLSKFMSGDRGLSFNAIDRLGEALDLWLVAKPSARRNQNKKQEDI